MKHQKFIVVDANIMLLLGVKACQEFNLVKRINTIKNISKKEKFISNNSDVFEGIESFSKICKIEIDEKSMPIS